MLGMYVAVKKLGNKENCAEVKLCFEPVFSIVSGEAVFRLFRVFKLFSRRVLRYAIFDVNWGRVWTVFL